MSVAKKKGASKLNLDRESGVRQKAPAHKTGEREREIGGVKLQEVFPYATDMAFESVDEAIEDAREKLGVVFSANGQTIMFPGYNDEEKEIPREKADAFAEFLRSELAAKNINVDKSGDTITLTIGKSDDPAEDQGYPRRK